MALLMPIVIKRSRIHLANGNTKNGNALEVGSKWRCQDHVGTRCAIGLYAVKA